MVAGPSRLVHLAPAHAGACPSRCSTCAKCGADRRDRGDLRRGHRRCSTSRAPTPGSLSEPGRVPAAHGEVCETCGCSELVPDKDILDVWWESGVSHTSVLQAPRRRGSALPGRHVPGGLRPAPRLVPVVAAHEHRRATACRPTRHVVSCGFTVDELRAQDVASRWATALTLPRSCDDLRRRRAAPVGGHGRLRAMDVSIADEHPQAGGRATYRRIPQHASASCWAACPTSTTRRMRWTRGRRSNPSTSWTMLRQDRQAARRGGAGLRRVPLQRRLPPDLRLLRERPVRRLHGRCRRTASTPRRRTRRAVAPCRRCWPTSSRCSCACWRPCISFTADEVWEHYPEPMRRARRAPLQRAAGRVAQSRRDMRARPACRWRQAGARGLRPAPWARAMR